jgi:hypothetical protein
MGADSAFVFPRVRVEQSSPLEQAVPIFGRLSPPPNPVEHIVMPLPEPGRLRCPNGGHQQRSVIDMFR